jgi:diacylglycerol kinase family enzyme
VARTAGIPHSVDKALEVIFKGKTKRTDVFFVNNNLSCHVCGLGFDALVAHEFARQKKRGLHSYTRLSLKKFFSARPYSFNIETPEETFRTDAFLICIANSNQFGNNFKIAPAASISDGLLDIVILKKTSKPQIVFSFVKQILYGKVSVASSQKHDKKNILYFQTDRIKIENLQSAPFHIDGDPAQTDHHFSIEILPSAYRLIQP